MEGIVSLASRCITSIDECVTQQAAQFPLTAGQGDRKWFGWHDSGMRWLPDVTGNRLAGSGFGEENVHDPRPDHDLMIPGVRTHNEDDPKRRIRLAEPSQTISLGHGEGSSMEYQDREEGGRRPVLWEHHPIDWGRGLMNGIAEGRDPRVGQVAGEGHFDPIPVHVITPGTTVASPNLDGFDRCRSRSRPVRQAKEIVHRKGLYLERMHHE